MDKSKNRTDMLAAGRKKLQQFRQKKDNKGGSSHGKSSSRLAKPEKEGEGELPSISAHGSQASATDLDIANQLDASASITDGRSEEVRVEAVQLPADFDNQEARGCALVKLNGGSLDFGHEVDETFSSNVFNERGGNPTLSYFNSEKEVSDKENEGIYEMEKGATEGETFSSNVSNERGGDPTLSYVNSQKEVSDKENEGIYEMEKGATEGEASSSALHEPDRMQEANASSVLADRFQSVGLNCNLFNEMEKDTYYEENLERPAPCLSYALVAVSRGGVPVDSGVELEGTSSDRVKVENLEQQVFEDKREVIACHAVYRPKGSEEANPYFGSAEESQEVSMNLSHEPDEGTSLGKTLVMTSSPQEISENNEVHHLEMEKRTDEQGIEHYLTLESLPSNNEFQGRKSEDSASFEGIIVDANEGLSSLEKHKTVGPSTGSFSEQNGDLMDGSSAAELESIRSHLYLSYIAKDVLQLQLVEQTQLYDDFHEHSSDEVHRLSDLVIEAQESQEMVTEELVQCKSELHVLTTEKDEIETKNLCARKEAEDQQIKYCNLKNEMHISQEDLFHVSEELATCRGSLDALQKENLNLLTSLISETDAKKKLLEEVEFLSSEQMKLTAALKSETDARKKIAEEKELLSFKSMQLLSELTAKEERLHIALEKKVKLQDNLIEIGSCFEQLAEDNFYLSSSLELHKAKIKELESLMFEPTCHIQEAQISNGDVTRCNIYKSHAFCEESNVDLSSGINLKSKSLLQDQGPFLQKVDGKDSNSYSLLMVLKDHLQEAKLKLQDLEKSVQGMRSHSLCLSGSSGRAAAAGVSKLIQAFESKVHIVGGVVDEVPLTHAEKLEDPYALSEELTLSLSNTLNHMELELATIEIYVMNDQHKREVLKKFEMDYESQKQQNNSFQVTFDERAEKVVDYESKINDLLYQIDELHQHVNEEVAGFLNEMELLKRQASGDLSILKQERDALLGMIFEAIEKLDASTGLKVFEDLDTKSLAMTSVDAAILAIEKLHDKLEAASLNYNTLHASYEELNKSFIDMQGKHSLASELLNQFNDKLTELMNEDPQNVGDAAMNAHIEKVIDHLPEKCEIFFSYLRKLLNERIYLLSRNNMLDSDLSIRNQEIEELKIQLKEVELQRSARDGLESTLLYKTEGIEEVKRRCLVLASQLEDHESCKDLYAQARSIERGEAVVPKHLNDEIDSCNSLLLRLEELIAFHLHNYKEILEQIHLSRKLLKDSNMLVEVSDSDCFLPLPTLLSHVLLPKLGKLHEELQLLILSNVHKETEIHILKECVSKMEEDVEESCYVLKLKASEVEQLEQKLSSVREKLSIAVAKGKGLIVQRDSLKQSLMEKANELEKSSQELLLKETLLHDLEAKLKSCSEVERIEALESELSYIRNSATTLRDSFLQKDSVLQRIEEILEDLDLPDDFHDKDILEKIELLSRFSIVHPSTLTGWGEKSSEQHAHSDTGGSLVMDGNKNHTWPGSNLDFEELKRKYEELQGKFYDLAEHNDMLEQSLLERNNIVQKCEGILDKIDMPSHMGTMEPEDKIEWLGRELSEVKQERDSLQLKIDNLEISSDMLIVDLEESHKKISELTAEVVGVRSEKDFFSESLEKLRFEYFALSEKAVHDELDRENLQMELDDLQEKLIDYAQFEYYKNVANSMQKLHDLVNSALMKSDMADSLSSVSLAEHLEESLKRLIDNYTALLNKSSPMVSDKETPSDDGSPALGKMVPEEMLNDMELDLASTRLELDRVSSELASVEQERATTFGNCQSLMLEIEVLKMQINVLNSEKKADVEKCQSLMLELDAISKQRKSLQEQLTLEEQKSASVKEKLNLAVRKGKGLVQQRDCLKQTVDEMNALVEQLKIDYSQQIEALESEKSLLMNRLAEIELNLQDSNQNYSRLLTALHAIDIESEANDIDPVQKLAVVRSFLLDVRLAGVAAEHEANKSKQAAELLLAELNEVQERNDILQDELAKAEASLVECSKQKDDSLSRLENLMSVHSAESVRVASSLVEFKFGVDQLREDFLLSSRLLSEVLSKDVNLFHYVEDFRNIVLDESGNPEINDRSPLSSNNILSLSDSKNEEISRSIIDTAQFKMHPHLDKTLLFDHLVLASQTVHECMHDCEELRKHIREYSVFADKKATYLLKIIDAVKRNKSSLKDILESLKRDITCLESELKEKDARFSSVYRNLTLLYDACNTSVMEIVKRKSQNSPALGEDEGKLDVILKLPSYTNVKEDEDIHTINDCIKTMADSIISIVKDASCINELVESNESELKATILALQRELQDKDVQMNKICEELISQIRDAESVAKRSTADLDSSVAQISNLKKKIEVMETDKSLLELRLNELQDVEAFSKQLQETMNSLTDTVNAKDQEIEALMQALDEEETQMETLESRNKDMENLMQQRVMQLETLETSHMKTMAKLSTTVKKFDELHNLSESLLVEIENLQAQLQGRDSEISFLRQEVTRCTNDVLASQEISKKYSSDIHELLTRMNAPASHFGGPPVHFDEHEDSQIDLYIDIIGKKIASAITEKEDLCAAVQCKDALLETERAKVQELLSRTKDLETSLHVKETLEQSQGKRGSGQPSSSNSSGTLEIEHMVQRNKVSSNPIATHVLTGRKVNNGQIAIAIDTEKDDGVLEEDDDKAHGFKSLTMSRLVPRATRPLADRIDGIWVSAERLLMRQPTLRLAFLMYWVALHALLASFI